MKKVLCRSRVSLWLSSVMGVAGAAALTLFARPAGAQLQLGAEQSVDKPAFAAASLDQQTPSVAFGAGMYLAVWRDGDKDVGQVWALRAVRIDANGAFLDDPPLTVRSAGEDLVRPAVGFDGTNFLVVWERSGDQGDPNSTDIFGTYVSPMNGSVGTVFTVAGGPAAQTEPAIAGGDGYALVTYNEFATQSTAQGTQTVWGVLYGTNQVIKPKFQLSASSVVAALSAVAWSSVAQRFLVAWRDNDDSGNIFATQVDTTGATTTPFQVNQAANTTHDVSVGVSSAGFVVGWADDRPGPSSIYARAVPATGTPTANEFNIANAPGSFGASRPQILGVGGQMVALWERLSSDAGFQFLADIYAGRFLEDGTRKDANGMKALIGTPSIPPVLPSFANSYRSAVASAGTTGLAVLWRNAQGASKDDVVLLPIDPSDASFVPRPPSPLGREPNSQRSGSVATNGEAFLLVWEDNRTDNNPDNSLDVYGLRIGLDGVPLDSAPFLISVDATTPTLGARRDQFAPYASGIPGGPFLVVWSDGRGFDDPVQSSGLDLYAARIGTTGAPVQLPQHVSATGDAQLQPSIAASDAGWLVAWEDWSPSLVTGTHRSAVFTAFVPKVDAGQYFARHQLSLSSALLPTACGAAVTWNGAHFFVAYEQPCAEDYGQPQADLIGRWHGADGTPLGNDVRIAQKTFNEVSPSLTSFGGRVFAVWDEKGSEDAILASTFTDLEPVADAPTTTIYSTAGVREAPSITATGGVVLISWVDEEPNQVSAVRRQATQAMKPLDAQPIVMHAGASFTGPGVLVQPIQFDDGTNYTLIPRFTPKPSVVASASGEAIVVANALVPVLGTTVSRLAFRKLGLAGNSAPCNSNGACADGICTAGTCCDVVCDGVCQTCSVDGCVATPPADSRCPMDSTTSCASLSTSCRTFSDTAGAGACVAFGECATTASAAVCHTFTDKLDGASCTAPGCAAAASCQSGACVCSTDGNMLEPARSVGCSAVPGSSNTTGVALLGALLLMLSILRRRSTR